MKRLSVLIGLVFVLLLSVSASANHDPIHSACLVKIANIETKFHSSGTPKQRLDRVHTAIHAPSLCETEPTPPPPPNPVQGENLPTRYTQNITRQYWVDPVGGSDSFTEAQARDNEANAWLTFQKAADTLIVPTTGDTAIRLKEGIVQGADNSSQTVRFNRGIFNSTHRLVIKPADGATPIVRLPGGSTGTQRTGIRINDGFVIIENLELDSAGKPGASGVGGNALWFEGSTSNIEIFGAHIHDLDLFDSGTTRIQGIQGEDSTAVQIWNTRIHDTGSSAHQANQEHGIYTSGDDWWLINCLIYNVRNGYGLQFFPSAWGTFRVVNSTIAFGPLSGTRGPVVYDPRNGGGAGNLIFRNSIFYQAPSGVYVIHGSGTAPTAGAYTIDHVLGRKGSGSGPVEFPADFTSSSLDTTEANSLNFVDAANADFRLQANSPAIGFTDTTWSPPFDIDGNSRPPGSEDAGAFQTTRAPGWSDVRIGG